MFKVILVLDENSKKSCKLDSSVLNSENIFIVSALLDIQEEQLDENRKVIILEGFLNSDNCIGQLRFFKDVAKLSYIFLISKEVNAAYVQNLGFVYNCDLAVIDYELVQASLYNDNSLKQEYLVVNDSVEFAQNLLHTGNEMEQALANNYLAALQREEALMRNVTKQQASLDTLISRNAVLSAENMKWYTGCKTLIARIAQQNEMMQRYENVFATDIYYKLNLYDYPNKPIIVYLKVFTDFSGINTFIETIVDSFRYQLKHSVKVLQLFDSSGDRRIRLLPDYYHRLRNYYNMEEVVNNNYLCKSGDYFNLLERLLTNKYGLGVIVIVDNKDHDDTIFNGTFLQYNLCRTAEQARKLGLAQNNTVLNQNVKSWHNWIPVKTAQLSKKEKFIKLSSRKVIQNILEMSEKMSNSF